MAKSTEMMEQAKKIWANLGLGQKAAVVGITLAVFAGVLLTTFLASKPEYKTLRSGVSAKDIGAITAQLDSLGMSDYRITADAGTILINANDFEAARTALYKAGIMPADENAPRDNLGLLGPGALTGDAATWHFLREDEDRVSRLIRGIDDVENAKVTITKKVRRYYKGGDQNAKAAVIVKTRNNVWNRNLSDSIAMTVAGSVEGLSPDDVAITANGQLARRPGRGSDGGLADEDQLAVQTKTEEEKEFKAQEALSLVAGPGKVVVRVSVDMDWTRQQISSKAYDPEGVRTEKTTTKSTKDGPHNASGAAGGQANQNGVNAGAAGIGFSNSSTTERNEFGVTERNTVKSGPELKRMTAAILIDQSLADKRAEIEKIVGAAIGYDQSRGDEISAMVTEFAGLPEVSYEDDSGAPSTSVTILNWVERGIWIVIGVIFLFVALRTVKKAQAGLREVLTASLEDENTTEPMKPITLEETVFDTAMQDTELAGRSLRRWLYEGAAEKV